MKTTLVELEFIELPSLPDAQAPMQNRFLLSMWDCTCRLASWNASAERFEDAGGQLNPLAIRSWALLPEPLDAEAWGEEIVRAALSDDTSRNNAGWLQPKYDTGPTVSTARSPRTFASAERDEPASKRAFKPLSDRRRIVAKWLRLAAATAGLVGLWQVVRFLRGEIVLPAIDHIWPRTASLLGFEWYGTLTHGMAGAALLLAATIVVSYAIVAAARAYEIGISQYLSEQRELDAKGRARAERKRRRDAFAIARARRQKQGWGTTGVVVAFALGWFLF
jgi:hypothetical protein